MRIEFIEELEFEDESKSTEKVGVIFLRITALRRIEGTKETEVIQSMTKIPVRENMKAQGEMFKAYRRLAYHKILDKALDAEVMEMKKE